MDHHEDTLCGWELNNPDIEVFDTHIVEVFGACKTCEYVDECVTPCESVRRLVPKEGAVVMLGHLKESNGPKMTYFALVNQNDVKFILLSEPDHYWAKASYIARENVPAWALSRFASEEGTKRFN